MVAPNIPLASIIQNKTNEPIKGVTIIGKIVPNIVGPLIDLDIVFILKATINPKTITGGVTVKQKVIVNKSAL